MRHALSIPNVGPPERLVEIARAADTSGWDGVFVWDHLHFQRTAGLEVHDPWVLLGALATATEHVRLGTMVTPLSRRRPWRWAKEIITLDHLSGGRAIAAVGLGEPPVDDFATFGDTGDVRERAERLDEGLELAAALWSGDDVHHAGRHFQVDARLRPPPVQQPRPPVWIAGKWPNRGPIERARRWDGYVPIAQDGGPMGPEVVAELVRALAPSPGFEIVVNRGDGATAEQYEAAGATWLLESRWPFDGFLDELAEVAAQPVGPRRGPVEPGRSRA